MDFGAFEATETINPAYRRIKELGLESHVFDIETYGFTIVPPEKVASREFFERVRETVLRVARERTGEDSAARQERQRRQDRNCGAKQASVPVVLPALGGSDLRGMDS